MRRANPWMYSSGTDVLSAWRPRTLDDLGLDEKFLEDIVARQPDLLNIRSLRSGIFGKLMAFRQLSFQSPQGRNIRPDIVFLSESGHVVVAEVKRGSNRELRDRSVIAQVVDYAGSFAKLSEQDFYDLLGRSWDGDDSPRNWRELVAAMFSENVDPVELAEELLNRFQGGEIHLCIVCDYAPAGIRELIEGVASQSSLAFDLSLAEVRPYTRDDEPDEILFVPETAIETEIVGRTVVEVRFLDGDKNVETTITTDTPQQITKNLEDASRRRRASTEVNWAAKILRRTKTNWDPKNHISSIAVYEGKVICLRLDENPLGNCELHLGYLLWGDDHTCINVGVWFRDERKTWEIRNSQAQPFLRLFDLWLRKEFKIYDLEDEEETYPHSSEWGLGWGIFTPQELLENWTPDAIAEHAIRVIKGFEEQVLNTPSS